MLNPQSFDIIGINPRCLMKKAMLDAHDLSARDIDLMPVCAFAPFVES